jgi:hypothetical protein
LWSRWRREAATHSAAIVLQVDPSHLHSSLQDHLEASGCLVSGERGGEIEAQLLNSVSERHDLQTLLRHVRSWNKAHPAARVRFVAQDMA